MKKLLIAILCITFSSCFVGCENTDMELLKNESAVKQDYKERLSNINANKSY